MRSLLTVFLLIVPVAASASAQEKSWVGKSVLVKRVGIKIDGDKQLEIATLEEAAYKVLDEKDGRLKVKTRNGVVGWFDRDDAVRLEDAVAYFTERIAEDTKDANLHNSRGAAWRLRGEPDKAIQDYSEAIRLDPSAPFFSNRGLAWLEKKQADKAIADFTKAIALDPETMHYRANRGSSYAIKKEYDKAIADFNEAIRLAPREAGLYVNRGTTWLEKKDLDKAIADFTEAIRLEPKNADLYLTRGFAWSAKKEYEKAIADYDEAIRIIPKYAPLYLSRGLAFSRSKQFAKALADYKEVIRLDPKYAQGYNGVAWLLATAPDEKVRDGKAAVEHAKKAIELEPKKAAWYGDTLAAAYAELGNFDEAVRLQERALEDPDLKEDAEAKERLELYRKKMPYRQ